MELRSCNHFHFIQAVKGGSVVKTLNVFRGRPAVKFKKLSDVYGVVDTSNDTTFPILIPKCELEDVLTNWDKSKPQSSSMLTGVRTDKAQNVAMGFSCTGSVSGVKSEADDDYGCMTLNEVKERCKEKKRKHSVCEVKSEADNRFGCMTLNEVKERCKEKKRKHSKKVDSSKGGIQNSITTKRFSSDCRIEEDENDIMETLSSLRSKLPKKMKTKKKSRKTSVYSEPKYALAVVKNEEIPNNQVFNFSETFCFPIAIKTEDPEPGSWDGENLSNENELFNNCMEAGVSHGVLYSEVPMIDENGILHTGVLVVRHEETESGKSCVSDTETSTITRDDNTMVNCYGLEEGMPNFGVPQVCLVNEDNIEHVDTEMIKESDASNVCGSSELPKAATICTLATDISTCNEENAIHEACLLEPELSTSSDEKPGATNNCVFETDKQLLSYNEPQVCVLNEISYEYIEHSGSEAILDVSTLNESVMPVNSPKVTSDQFLDLCHPYSDDSALRMPSSETSNSNDTNDDSQQVSSVHEQFWNISSDNQVPDISICNINQAAELGNKGLYSCLYEDGSDNDGSHLKASVSSNLADGCSTYWKSTSKSNPDDFSVSLTKGSPSDQEKQSKVVLNTLAARDKSTVIDVCIERNAASTKIEDSCNSMLQQAPERLFSNRKTISPTSQKRLCRAMDSAELDDEQYYKYARKLCYSKLTNNKIGRQEANHAQKAEVTFIPKPITKLKNYNNGFHQSGIPKGPPLDRALRRFSSGSTSLQSCSESAISFSQQQMHDFQFIATNLAKQLKSMKNIVEERLQPMEDAATSSNYSMDEVRKAVQNATRVEEATQKHLSAVARDCKRFCKIMKLTVESSSAPDNLGCKVKKRKIAFADEAGGELCDIKTFENDMSSLGDSDVEKQVIVD